MESNSKIRAHKKDEKKMKKIKHWEIEEDEEYGVGLRRSSGGNSKDVRYENGI